MTHAPRPTRSFASDGVRPLTDASAMAVERFEMGVYSAPHLLSTTTIVRDLAARPLVVVSDDLRTTLDVDPTGECDVQAPPNGAVLV